MSSKKDMRREDLIVPYVAPDNGKELSDVAGTMASTLPMAAIFTRNKVIGWTAVLFAIQSWLSESSSAKSSGAPAVFTVLMAFMSLGVTYMGLFMPPAFGGPAGRPGTGTDAPAAAPASS